MELSRSRTAAWLLCALVALVSAHGDEHADMSMDMAMGGMSHGANSNATSGSEHNPFYDEPNYFGLESYSGLMLGHILFMVAAWFFVLPIGEFSPYELYAKSLTQQVSCSVLPAQDLHYPLNLSFSS